jgi:LEA14-like dessication related protein
MTPATQFVPRLIAVMILAVVSLAPQGCATLQGRDPLHVTVVGIEPLESQGLELRMLVKLRVQNPNDAAVDYNGVALEMNVREKTFASGVSDAGGSVPRFGEVLISVPVTVSAFSMLGQAFDMIRSGGSGPITYEMKGKLNGSGFNSTHFRTQGEFELPATGAADHAN